MGYNELADAAFGRFEGAFGQSASPVLAPFLSIEESLNLILPPAEREPQPLHRAMRYAVFSGGKRLRPKLLLQVAVACGANDAETELAVRVACAVELIHTASLVHDDLPCFDDAAERRGQPTVHVKFGEAMAVLVGDSLLTLAFELLADAPIHLAPRTLRLLRLLGRATGSSSGIIGGQSLEQRDVQLPGQARVQFSPELIARYHQMKTGALFQMATEGAAIAAGATNPVAWAVIGQMIGTWYQLADDFMDVYGQAGAMGKPVGQDAALGRPNALLCSGKAAVKAQLHELFSAIRSEILVLAAAPNPLLGFLSALRNSILHETEEQRELIDAYANA